MQKNNFLKSRYNNNSSTKEYLKEIGSVKLNIKDLEKINFDSKPKQLNKQSLHIDIDNMSNSNFNKSKRNQKSVISKYCSLPTRHNSPFELIACRLKESHIDEIDKNTYVELFNKRKKAEAEKKLKMSEFLNHFIKKKQVKEIKPKGYSKINNIDLNKVTNANQNINNMYKIQLDEILEKRDLLFKDKATGKYGYIKSEINTTFRQDSKSRYEEEDTL